MSSTLSLPAELTIYTVAELHPQWLAWLDEAEAPPDKSALDDALLRQADGAAVAEVDAAGVQLLLALHKSLAQRGMNLQLLDPSRVLSEACTALGVARLLPKAAADAGANDNENATVAEAS